MPILLIRLLDRDGTTSFKFKFLLHVVDVNVTEPFSTSLANMPYRPIHIADADATQLSG